MRDVISAVVGKSVRQVARLRGGGSALPGLVVEKIDPGFLSRVLGRLPYGVVAVSGTNGKTTTTKMIVEMLEAEGLRVFTNRTGSNFSRGVVAAAIAEGSLSGKLDADIAVLELDEAHAMYFIDRVPPRFTLLLNVLRDQLDRFGEIDTTAKLLQRIADATSEGLVVNREDRLIHAIGERTRERSAAVDVREFGLSADLLATFPSDDDFHADAGAGVADSSAADPAAADVTLVELGDHEAVFRVDGVDYRTPLKLEGLYNTFNAAAALAVVRQVLGAGPLPGRQARVSVTPETSSIVAALAKVRPAFGRGEQLELDGQPLELVLVKNPAGFRLGLASFDASGVAAMIAINDQYADGRDMSWLWDVDFTSLAAGGVDTVSGTRAWDMALRLEHDEVPVAAVQEDLGRALTEFRQRTMGQPRRIYCTYTAMLELRRALAELTDVEDIW
ncbi:Mur ligase family protein [Leucobacter luti]|uniref:Lipid II isoglutaminyl synthase (glutamine-hydrolyzing) subunit MurT n=1 Tax=Leucobacter luti TaxID=340320 RepID=A0A4Q7TXE3_9MICO|nr:Mur ligase family protein [Leucobacter luti]MBL3698126.1 Mur ligase family protein [Leucobacter luti]RZT64790.1 UDP-N-acetylmuramyl tripeptide synthase [Leucobacter luti]